jgi:head-tail adaptor
MSWMAPKLKNRIQIRKAVQTPNTAGGADQTYETITTLWAEIKALSDYIKAIRGANGNEADTHSFKVRMCAVTGLGKEFSAAFSTAFKGEDIYPLKSDYFIFDQAGLTTKGRLFKITGVGIDEQNSEFVKLTAREIEETGTGYNV